MKSQGTLYRPSHGIKGTFDQIVIGSGMGGLSVASMLAQQGHKVLVLEQHNVIGGLTQSYERAGYKWTVGMHYIGDVGSPATTTRKLFDYVTGNGIEWAPMPEIFNRAIIGDREYPIPAGAEQLREALTGWFPEEAQAIDQYLQLLRQVSKSSAPYFALKAFPETATPQFLADATEAFQNFASRTTLEVLSELTSNADLIAVLCANWGDYGIEPDRSSFAMHCMLAKHYLNGASYPAGGGAAFADAIAPIIEEAGGALFYGAEVEQILVADGAVQGVRLSSGEDVLCPVVISNAGVRNTYGTLLSADVRSQIGVDAKLAQVTDTYSVVGLNIGLEGEAEDFGFHPANIWCHPGNDLVGNLAAHREDFSAPFAWTFITFPSSKDPHWKRDFPGKSTIEMYAATDFRHFEKWSGTRWMKRGDDYLAVKEQIKDRLLDQLYELVPQARGLVRHIEVSTPLTYQTFVKRSRGDFMGIESSPDRFRLDWLRARTPVDGLFLTGQDVATDGVIGALAGGVACASSVLQRDLMSEIRLQTSGAKR
jgi:all-trans-retinol 13,14-reductase